MISSFIVTLWASHVAQVPLKNVLYFLVDDLRPEMNVAYGQEYMHTPAFDSLAARGLTFSRAYCQIAVCAPSRSSFMSGIRPDASSIFNFKNHIRDAGQPAIVTLPGQFLKANYTVLGGGKTFHFDHPPYFDDIGSKKGSWSSSVAKYYPFNEFDGSTDYASCPIPEGFVMNPAKLPIQMCALDVPMDFFYDYRLATHTIETLRLVANITTTVDGKKRPKPWFVMAGFRRPHRVFQVHKKYYDLYPTDVATIATAKIQVRDPSQPEIAFHHGDFVLENGSYYPGNADKPWPIEVQQYARKGYYAAVSQTDAQVGRVLSELKTLGLTDKTVVVVHSDHGWQLGERGEWDKQTNFEAATRVPLIIAVPWKTASHGQHTSSFTDLVDMHPTIASLAGIGFTPPMSLGKGLSTVTQAFGSDVSSLLDEVHMRAAGEEEAPKNTLQLATASYSQWPSCGIPGQQGMCISSRGVLTAMGYSIRSQNWRYTAWVGFNNGSCANASARMFTADWTAGALLALELYNKTAQDSDPTNSFNFDDDGEVKNYAVIAGRQDGEPLPVQAELHKKLVAQFSYDAGWLAARQQAMIKRETKFELNMGFAPFD